MAALGQASGAELRSLEIESAALAGLAWRTDNRDHLLLANLTPEPVRIASADTLEGLVLDATTVAAARDPAWLEQPRSGLGPTIELGAHAVLFASR